MSRFSRLLCLLALAALPVVQAGNPPFDPLNSPVPAAKPAPAAAPARPVAAPARSEPGPKAAAASTAVGAAAPASVAAKPAFDPLHPVGPRTVDFDELEHYVGKAVQIRTNMRTTRRGTLKRFNRAGLVIEDMSRGFSMDIDMPRSTVVEVQVRD